MRAWPILLVACVDPGAEVPTDTEVTVEDTEPVVDTEPGRDTADHDTGPPVPTSGLVQLGPVVCLAPDRRADAPYVHHVLAADAAPGLGPEGAGVALADLTDDGRDEIVAVTPSQVLVWTWDGEELVRVVLFEEPLADARRGLFGATAFDADDDGDLDLLVTGHGVPTRLLANDGHGLLVDATATAGLGVLPADAPLGGAALADVDGDGDLDLFLAAGAVPVDGDDAPAGEGGRLLLGDGAGGFVDATASLPPELRTGWTTSALWLDADDDGDDDLYAVRERGAPSDLFWNDAGTLRADDGRAGLRVDEAMAGAAAGDLDGDGDEDLVASGPGGVHAWLRDPGGWRSAALGLGLVPSSPDPLVWAPTLADLDDDGRLDVVLAQGRTDDPLAPPHAEAQASAVLLQQADGTFVDHADAEGLGLDGVLRAVAVADLDGDGWAELVAVDRLGGVHVAAPRCGDDTWLEVRLQQAGANRSAVGATVVVTVDGTRTVRRVRAGDGALGASVGPDVHLGLGPSRTLDRLEVRWPDGEVEVWRDLPTRQRVVVHRD